MYYLAIKKYLEEHDFEALSPRVVLFDMDGVLYDSMPNHAIAWQESMAKYGIHMTADDAYATEGARGVDTIREMVRRQQHREIDEAEAQKMYDLKSQTFHSLPEAPVMPGILDLMRQIHASGLQCGVVTGSGQRPLISRILKDFGDYVDEAHITTAYDVTRGKPLPDPYLMGLHKAGDLAPWQAVVIENAPLGVRSGHAARIFTIAVNTGPLPNNELLAAGANLIFSSMTDFSEHWTELNF
ncbi:MAG: HAD hydrolase-like protein [Prevotella sp.]|jgi:HAD superfamily hydrolase (TIGR01509 family)|nr:HAD hydrolase-like protein [Prevotella sp.]